MKAKIRKDCLGLMTERIGKALLISRRVLFSSNDFVKSVVNRTVKEKLNMK